MICVKICVPFAWYHTDCFCWNLIRWSECSSLTDCCSACSRFSTTFFCQVCLLSHCGDGLTLSDYQRLKTQFVQAYGFQHLVTWNNLLKVSRSEIKMKDSISTGGLGQGEGWIRWWSNTGQVSSTKSSLAITSDLVLFSDQWFLITSYCPLRLSIS